MFKFFAIVSILIFGIQLSNCQGKEQPQKAITYLLDGSVLIGDVLEEGKYLLKMEIFTGDTVNVDKRLTKKIKRTGKDILLHNNGKYYNTNGFFWNWGIGFNLFTEQRPSTHLDLSFGHRLNKKFLLAGVYSFEYNRAIVSGLTFDTQFSSLNLYGRYYINDSKPRLFLYSRIGYGFPVQDESETEEHSGGWQTQNGVGIHFASTKKSRFILSLGHHFQQTSGNESFIDLFGNEIKTFFDIIISRPILKFTMEIK